MNFDCSADIVLQDERTLLRPLTTADYPHLLPIALSDDKLLQYSPMAVYTEALLQQYIEAAITERQKQQRYTFIIFDKKASQYAGSTSFLNISNMDRRLEIGATWLGKPFQQTGLNRHNKWLMLQYAFEQSGFERVEFKTDERNTASRTAIEKIGGKLEGILRSHTVMYDGYRRNTVYYSILRSEWPAIKQSLRR
jgi:RimJ/RimL family protein N-acetyltransferase